MRKQILSLMLAIIIILYMGSLSVPAAATIAVSYSSGIVTYTGSGFSSNTEYNIRLCNQSPEYLIAILTAISTADGRININIDVGTLANATYNVFVDGTDGTPTASRLLTVSSSSSSDSSGWSSSSRSSSSTTPNLPKDDPDKEDDNPETIIDDVITKPVNDGVTETIIDDTAEYVDDGNFIGNPTATPINFPETNDNDSNVVVTKASMPSSNSGFGKVPQTGLPDIVWLVTVMFFSLATSVTLFIYILSQKYKNGNNG